MAEDIPEEVPKLSRSQAGARLNPVTMISAERDFAMKKKPFTEQELLEDLTPGTAHADELAKLRIHELSPLERLKGSVKRYERPMDPVWDDYFDSDEGVSDDFMNDRNQPPEKSR